MRTDPGRCYPGREVGPGGHSGEVIVVTGNNRVAFVSCLKGSGYKSKLLTYFRRLRDADSVAQSTTLLYKVVDECWRARSGLGRNRIVIIFLLATDEHG